MSSDNPRKLRVIIISMGGEREAQMRHIFAQPSIAQDFEPPVFSPGIPSRSLRNRNECLKYAHIAGLIPDGLEWTALEREASEPQNDRAKFFDCLTDIPVVPGRRGSQQDVELHYSCEFWRKAKALNRGRAVLACLLAHLIAMREFVAHDMDVLLEDNVRLPIQDCARRIRESARASREWCQRDNIQSHFRYVGFLGSVTNLRWIYEYHIPRTACQRNQGDAAAVCTVFPFPTAKDIEQDLVETEEFAEKRIDDAMEQDNQERHSKPGGNPVWGCYGYWISKEGYETILQILRNDVGAMLWKGKRNRHYSVKPIDKVLPRQLMSHFGPTAVHLPTHPAFFRAPMLTSKIHTQWDPEFCKSTEFELSRTNLGWSDLCLTETEKAVVAHHEETGEWLTPMGLEQYIS